jgi:O-acetyl-ADP-ribose deacetylase (regulator of RNase III)
MIRYTQGNLLDADVEALVNTVNTVGVMGKGIALMFKERFPQNMAAYAKACKAQDVQTGKVFVTASDELMGPRWIVNFPTKQHWKAPSQLEWIVEGLQDLRRFLEDNQVRSIALPPLGAGNGQLDWQLVKIEIEKALYNMPSVDIVVYEPTPQYQNIAKRSGLKNLTPARAMIAEMVRRYWVLGMECSLLEVQKLAWFLERSIESSAPDNPLALQFKANIYGPYADPLRHLLDQMDGSYLHCDKRISDAGPLDVIWFDDSQKEYLQLYLKTKAMKPYLPALEKTSVLIDGFESPFGMELLSTVDWLLTKENIEPDVKKIEEGLQHWPAGKASAARKTKLFDVRVIELALQRLLYAGQEKSNSKQMPVE